MGKHLGIDSPDRIDVGGVLCDWACVAVKIKIDPVAKPRMTKADAWRGRPVVQKYWDYKDELNTLIRADLAPCLKLIFIIPMPKSWSKKKRAKMNHQPHQQVPDIDNFTKGLLDALCDNDSYIYHIEESKYWGEEGYIEIIELEAQSL